jgi:hypothetical protein
VPEPGKIVTLNGDGSDLPRLSITNTFTVVSTLADPALQKIEPLPNESAVTVEVQIRRFDGEVITVNTAFVCGTPLTRLSTINGC